MAEQLLLSVTCCKHRGCEEPVVGHSISGEGHVCRSHNVEEWGRALAKNRASWLRDLGRSLLSGLSDTQEGRE